MTQLFFFVAHDGEIYHVDEWGNSNFYPDPVNLCVSPEEMMVVYLDDRGQEIDAYRLWNSPDEIREAVGPDWFDEFWDLPVDENENVLVGTYDN